MLDGAPMGKGLDSLDIVFLTVGTGVRERYLKGGGIFDWFSTTFR